MISPKTVETHIRSIMLKLECNSRDGIISFVERSGKFSLIRKHYLDLLIRIDFKRKLSEIRLRKPLTCILCVNGQDDWEGDASLISEIEAFLKTVGFDVLLNGKQEGNPVRDLNGDESYRIIYVVSQDLLKKFQLGDEDVSKLLEGARQNPGFLTLLSLDEGIVDVPQEFRDVSYVDSKEYENQYLLFLKLLSTLLPDLDLEKVISEFKKHYELIHRDAERESSFVAGDIAENETPHFLRKSFKLDRRGLIGGTVGMFCLVALAFSANKMHWMRSTYETQNTIRSNLIVPTENILLKRAKLMAQIDEKLNAQKGIQTVVLIGMGGAGKTTLARRYLRSQKAPVVWEINAETRESLVSSFEHLAYAVSKTPEEKGEVDSLQKIGDSQERARRVLLVVKKKLKEQQSWCLLFDNVEYFSDVKDFYPLDAEVWGDGKVIITTRDVNVKNNNYIKPNSAINIDELDEEDVFTLFMGILSEDGQQEWDPSQKEQTKAFLQKIPPFPLDVSTAAYYIKETKIPYDDYIERLKISNEDFEKAQESLLKEMGDYTKTRYGIITLTLKKLIEKNPNFLELLLFITMLDSQDIPKNLLESYKNTAIVERLAHSLGKHSLIALDVSGGNDSLPMFSIHRSVQEVGLNYIKNNMPPADCARALQEITGTLVSYMGSVIDNYDSSQLLLLARHGEAFLAHKKSLNNTTQENSDQTIEFLRKLGVIHRQLGDSERSRELLEEGYQICKSLYGENNMMAGNTIVHLGSVYRNLGRYEEAEALLEKGFVILKRHYGENHAKIGWASVHLGSVYRNLGHYEKARSLLEHGLAIMKSHYGENHLMSGWALVQLGKTYRSLGYYEKAKDLLEKAVAIYKGILNEHHVEVGWSLLHLGDVYRDMGYHEKAKALLEQGLNIYRNNFGSSHVFTGCALIKMGKVYVALGLHKNALEFFDQARDIYKTHYGEDDIKFADLLLGIGQAYFLIKDMGQAEDTLDKALKIYRGKNHPESYLVLESLAQIYFKKSTIIFQEGDEERSQEFKKKAVSYVEQALEIAKRILPEDSAHIKRMESSLKEYS